MGTLKIPVNSRDHIQGDAEAACTLVEYGDYQCSNCGDAYPMVKELQAHFGERLRFVFRNFPLTRLHAYAEPAAEVAEFAASHNQFWQMHDLLFENQKTLGDDLFVQLATNLGLDSGQMQKALADKTFVKRVRDDFTGGVRSGVNGTPTFFINGQRHDGPMNSEFMIQAIERALEQ
jgi:protein-disulfide isomerase